MRRATVLAMFVLMMSAARTGLGQEQSGNSIQKEKAPPLQSPPEASAPSISREELERRIDAALKNFDHEPSLEDLQRAALLHLDADTETSRWWRKAPNRAALLPALKFVVDHDLERDEALDRYQDEPDRWGADTDRDLGFQISAQWKLDELVFNSDEVRVWSALADRASRRETLLTVLVGYYFERRKLQLKELLSPPANLQETAELKLRIAELTASIDALTAGHLTRSLKNSPKR